MLPRFNGAQLHRRCPRTLHVNDSIWLLFVSFELLFVRDRFFSLSGRFGCCTAKQANTMQPFLGTWVLFGCTLQCVSARPTGPHIRAQRGVFILHLTSSVVYFVYIGSASRF